MVSATNAALIFAAMSVRVGVPPPVMPAKLTCSVAFPSMLTSNVWAAAPLAVASAVPVVNRRDPDILLFCTVMELLASTPVREIVPSALALATFAYAAP